jgi:hypothetical protein
MYRKTTSLIICPETKLFAWQGVTHVPEPDQSDEPCNQCGHHHMYLHGLISALRVHKDEHESDCIRVVMSVGSEHYESALRGKAKIRALQTACAKQYAIEIGKVKKKFFFRGINFLQLAVAGVSWHYHLKFTLDN